MIVVVGGHSRNIGKTSVACGIIRSLPDWNWTAIKITQYGHGICSRNGEPCPCSDPTHPVSMAKEEGVMPATDSGRFLASGAAQSWWVRTPAGSLVEAIPRIKKLIDAAENIIIESNSILRFIRPDFYASVLDASVEDFKPTSQQYLDRADALVITGPHRLHWPHIPPSILRNIPRYNAPPPDYRSDKLIAAIEAASVAVKHCPQAMPPAPVRRSP
jgi:hypothetical protein